MTVTAALYGKSDFTALAGGCCSALTGGTISTGFLRNLGVLPVRVISFGFHLERSKMRLILHWRRGLRPRIDALFTRVFLSGACFSQASGTGVQQSQVKSMRHKTAIRSAESRETFRWGAKLTLESRRGNTSRTSQFRWLRASLRVN
jgi:hypothetical protein